MTRSIASYIDHTILKPVTTSTEVRKLCADAAEYGFAAVCVPPPYVRTSKLALEGTKIKVATVVGFPFGYSNARAKLVEVQQAITDGADELDIVINIAALKNGAWDYLSSEMELLNDEIQDSNRISKVIIESGVLTDEEIRQCCSIYADLHVNFLKTSTGYAESGASLKAVQLMRTNLPSDIQIKASGGIKTYEFARQLVEAGASRIGCSASIAIVQQETVANE